MPTDQQRVELAMNYMAAAREVVGCTRDREASRYLEHLIFSGVVCRIHSFDDGNVGPAGLQPLSNLFGKSGLSPLLILPAYEEDRLAGKVGGFYEDFLKNDRALASYRRWNNEIFLRASLESPFIKGNTLLHEAGHAYLAMRKGKVGQDFPTGTQEEFLEEGQLYAMNARLWRLWGGSEYQIILDKAFYRMDKMLRNFKGDGAFDADERWADVFDKVFGPAPTPDARQCRLNLFRVYANLEWLEKQGHQPVDQIRAQVVQHSYRTC